jgi:hypothetical protein
MITFKPGEDRLSESAAGIAMQMKSGTYTAIAHRILQVAPHYSEWLAETQTKSLLFAHFAQVGRSSLFPVISTIYAPKTLSPPGGRAISVQL